MRGHAAARRGRLPPPSAPPRPAPCAAVQLWRLVTNFLFFGSVGVDFLFHMYFLVRYSRALEEGSFRGNPADYLFFLIIGMVLTLVRQRAPHCMLND